MKFLVPAAAFFVALLIGMSFHPAERGALESTDRRFEPEPSEKQQTKPAEDSLLASSGQQAIPEDVPPRISTPENSISKLRKSGTPERVLRALLVDQWLEWIAANDHTAVPLPIFSLDCPIPDRKLLLDTRLQALAQALPEQFEQEILAMPQSARSKLAAESLAGCAEAQPRKALGLARKLGGKGIAVDEQGIFLNWARRAPQEALAEARNTRGTAARLTAETSAWQGWMLNDPIAAMREFEAKQGHKWMDMGKHLEADASLALSQSLFAADPAGRLALKAARTLSSPGLTADVFSVLAETSTEQALSAVKQEVLDGAYGRFASHAIKGAAQGLGAAGGENAFASLSGMLNKIPNSLGVVSFDIYKAFAKGYAASSPEEAKSMAENLMKAKFHERGVGRELLFNIGVMNAQNPAGALELLPKNLRAEDREAITVKFLSSFPPSSDWRMSAALIDDIHNPTLKNDALESVIDRASYSDIQSAMKWAGENESKYPGVAQMAMRIWSGMDPYTASEAVAAMPEGDVRDAYIPGLVSSIAGMEADSAVRWAMSAANPSVREEALRQLAEQARRHGSALETLLATEGLSDEGKNIIRNNWK